MKYKIISIFLILSISLIPMLNTGAEYYIPAWQGDTQNIVQFQNNYYFINQNNTTSTIYINTTLNTIYMFYNITFINMSFQIYDKFSNIRFFITPLSGLYKYNIIEVIVKADNTTVIENTNTYYYYNYTATSINITGSQQAIFHSWTAIYLGSSSFAKNMQNTTYIVVALLMLFIFISIILYLIKLSRGEE